MPSRLPIPALVVSLLLAIATSVPAAIPVEGVADKTRYADTASFRITVEAGYSYAATLNGATIEAGVLYTVGPDYYDLVVNRSGGTPETTRIEFIVRASERASTEIGLPPWTPHPLTPSADAEYAGASLVVVAPAEYPQGLEIPVIALAETGLGVRAGVNGVANVAGFPSSGFRIFRGVGSGAVPAATAADALALDVELGPISAVKMVAVDATTTWQTVSGTIAASANWGEGARIHIAGDVTINAGVTVTVGAGSVVRIAKGVDITVNGALNAAGSRERPVVFAPAAPDAPWGGFIFNASATTTMTGAILTGSGEDGTWFDMYSGAGSSHKKQQALFWLGSNARATLTDCYLIHGYGQGGHGEGGFLTMTRCLAQGFTTTGQYNNGSVNLEKTALIEFPSADSPFVDGDNDCIYLTGGSTIHHSLTDCLLGWTLDDCVDAGGGAMTVDFTNCWFEGNYHDAFAMSADGVRNIKNCVVTDAGQGIECGFNSNKVYVTDSLSTANCIGARFGDSYDWDYTGFLDVKTSLLLYNYKDVWAKTWDLDASDNPIWSEHIDQTSISGNLWTIPNPKHPGNSLWNPAADAERLAPFLRTPDGTVGIAIATRADRVDPSALEGGVPVRLSTFTRRTVTASWTSSAGETVLASGTLTFLPGETLKKIPFDPAWLEGHPIVAASISSPTNAQLTGRTRAVFIEDVTIVPLGSLWKYRNDNVDQGTAWRALDFNDAPWKEDLAELGHGDGDEATDIDIGPSGSRYPTIYFRKTIQIPDPAAYESFRIRLIRDDGAVVYVNGDEVFRSNMNAGTVHHADWSAGVISGGDETAPVAAELSRDVFDPGANVIAVEVHQSDAGSSDVSFDLELIGVPAYAPAEGEFIRGDPNGDGVVDLADAVRALFVLYAGFPAGCEDAIDADDNGILELTDAIRILEYLFAAGAVPPAPFPAAGPDPTPDSLSCP